jgi:hypothetical protein
VVERRDDPYVPRRLDRHENKLQRERDAKRIGRAKRLALINFWSAEATAKWASVVAANAAHTRVLALKWPDAYYKSDVAKEARLCSRRWRRPARTYLWPLRPRGDGAHSSRAISSRDDARADRGRPAHTYLSTVPSSQVVEVCPLLI